MSKEYYMRKAVLSPDAPEVLTRAVSPYAEVTICLSRYMKPLMINSRLRPAEMDNHAGEFEFVYTLLPMLVRTLEAEGWEAVDECGRAIPDFVAFLKEECDNYHFEITEL